MRYLAEDARQKKPGRDVRARPARLREAKQHRPVNQMAGGVLWVLSYLELPVRRRSGGQARRRAALSFLLWLGGVEPRSARRNWRWFLDGTVSAAELYGTTTTTPAQERRGGAADPTYAVIHRHPHTSIKLATIDDIGADSTRLPPAD